MKISLDWLKDYIDLPESIDIRKLAYDLTMSTVEVEGAEPTAEKFNNIVAGKIIEVLPHPNADKLRICRTDVGGEIKQIVCGGTNLRDGMTVAVAKPGAFVRWHGEGGLVEIKNAKLRGAESYGMICASSEIGLFDLFPTEENAVIVDLSDFDAAPGTRLDIALGIDDVILEIDNQSLTNRPDLWGHYGIARELSALYGIPLKGISCGLACQEIAGSGNPGLRIAIDAPERCARYMGLRIENVSAKASSFKIQSRLWRVGQRPINALVDITNYVMLALGQPTHAFDSGNIEGGITVRKARDGEKLLLLNGRELSLSPEDLVIADDEEAVALAGIMGGSKDSVLEGTTDVILEIANFSALGTRKTATRFELRTEASVRYEKGIEPQRVELAASLSASLFASEFPSMRITACADNYPRPLMPPRVKMSLEWLARRMGKKIPEATIRAMLERLGFTVEIDGDVVDVTPPSWRSTGDISLPDDIMEEIARLHGYENFEPSPIVSSFTRTVNQREHELERRLREYLSFRCGMQEIFTYPWVKDTLIDTLSLPKDGMLRLSTPPAPEESRIRSSLLPNIIDAVSKNVRNFADGFAIYELAQVFYDRGYEPRQDEREKLPAQRRRLSGAIAGSPGDIGGLFRRAKGIVENMPRFTHMAPFSFGHREGEGAERTGKPAWADGTVWLSVMRGDEAIGCLALLSKKPALDCGIKQAAVMVFDLDVDAMKAFPSRTNSFARPSEYPQAEHDISMMFDESVKWSDIESAAMGKRGPDDLVREARFIGEYRGSQIPRGKKSVTVRLVIGSDAKTLTSEEIEKASGTITKRLSRQLGGELRA
ncbi:MAG: phenylalanine--tRNA ligase subunit beta [Synergistaceae bacterium]|jgi:phenylalanyl-tRNA synthetase beta chain|nr:phenylalanine--tRNA ligase subunit beta [Synergistaceae bacterium]